MATPALTISPEKICFIVVKAREFDAKDEVTDPEPASDAADDHMIAVLEDHGEDPTYEELVGFIDSLNWDEQIDLVAMAWLGRGDGETAWRDLRAEAERQHNERTSGYLLGLPLLADYLEEALSQFGLSCEEYEMGRL